jgi:hypothetical protein
MKPSAILLSLLAFVFTMGCASSREHRTPTPERLSSVDCELYFSVTSVPVISGNQNRYTIGKDAMITKTGKRALTRRLTADGWKQFQSALNKLDVYRWKSEYSENICEGYAWEFRLAQGNRSIQSKGDNAGPSPSDPKRTVSIWEKQTSADVVLTDALEDLWKSSFPTVKNVKAAE